MNQETRVLHIGIASREQMRERTIAIARGEYVPGPNEPKVWFTSLKSLAEVLSSKNQLLLEMIRRMRPTSMQELAVYSGRKASNLSRTLHTMERYKLVQLTRLDDRIVPEVPYEMLSLDLPLAVQAAVLRGEASSSYA
jgi:predicted transcriptional regulator